MIYILIQIILSILFILWLSMNPFYWRNRGVHYEIPLPIFSSSYHFIDAMFKLYKKTSKFGIYGMHFFNQVTLFVTDIDLVKEILITKSDKFINRGIYISEYDQTSKQVTFLTGNKWKRMREKLTPYFSPSKLKMMNKNIIRNVQRYSKELNKIIDTDNKITQREEKHICDISKNIPEITTKSFLDLSNNNEKPNAKTEINGNQQSEVEINGLSLKLTTDVTANIFFGVKGNSFDNEQFLSHHREAMLGTSLSLSIAASFISKFLYNLFGLTFYPKKNLTEMHRYFDEVFYKKKLQKGQDDFISGMLELVNKSEMDPGDLSKRFTTEDAAAQCITMFLAGTETTGITVSFLLYELAYHQNVQDKVREEINRVFNNTPDGPSSPCYDQMKNLTYTTMTINETLRKYPIAPTLSRECNEATVINGVKVEKGVFIIIPIRAIQMDPKYFPEPDKFKPERFQNPDDIIEGTYFPFGLGPRTCIGMKFSQIEITQALCEIIPKFRILPHEKTPYPMTFDWNPVLMNPNNGVWVNIQRI